MAPLWPYRTYTYLSIDSSPLTLINLTDPTHSESTRGSATFASAIVWSATKLDNSQHTLLVSITGIRSSAVIDAILYTAPSHRDVRFIAIGSSIGGFVLLTLLVCLCMFMQRYRCIRRSKNDDCSESAQSASASPAKMESPPVSRAVSLHRHDPSPAFPAAEIITKSTSRHARRVSQPELRRAPGIPSVVPSFPPMRQAHGLRFPTAARTVCHSAPPSPTVPMYPIRKESHLRHDSNANLAGMGSGSGYFHSRRESLSGVSILDPSASASARAMYAAPRTTPGDVVRHYSYSNLLPTSTSAAVAQGDIGLTGQMGASSRPASWIDFVLPLKQGSQAQMQLPSSMSRSTADAGRRRDVGVHVTPQDSLDKLDASREVSQPEEHPSQTAVEAPPPIPCSPSFVKDAERELAGPFAIECFTSEVVEVSPVEATKWTPHADASESRALVTTPALIPPERDFTPPPPPPQCRAGVPPAHQNDAIDGSAE